MIGNDQGTLELIASQQPASLLADSCPGIYITAATKQEALAPMTERGRVGQATAHRPYRAATREGKKIISAPVDPAAHRQLKVLAAETGQKAEELIREALRDLFTKHGKPPIA